MNTSVTRTTDLEGLLAAAGIDFTIVDRCPDPACVVCVQKELSAAA